MEQKDANADFDAWVDALSQSRTSIAEYRALSQLGWDEAPALDEGDDDTMLYLMAVHHELSLMYVGDIFESLKEKGLLTPKGVLEDGEIEWEFTELGKEVGEALTGAEKVCYTSFHEGSTTSEP